MTNKERFIGLGFLLVDPVFNVGQLHKDSGCAFAVASTSWQWIVSLPSDRRVTLSVDLKKPDL